MKYMNAAKILPDELLIEIQKYAQGELIYIPKNEPKNMWGECSGSKAYYRNRNKEILFQYREGKSVEDISKEFGLAFDTVKKIIYT